jgi:GAF domain-containing protein
MAKELSPDPPLIALLLETGSLEDFLRGLANRAIKLAVQAQGCGVTLQRDGRPLTVTSVGTSASVLDEAQYGQDDGPCLEALRSGHEVDVPDMIQERRWESFPAYAAASGTRSSLSLPIAPHTGTAGALNLYAPVPHAFVDADLTSLRLLAAQATGAIELAQRLADAQQFVTDLQTALQSRTVIDQAMGVIMGQQRCTPEEAFQILRTASQHRNVKLRDLCAALIAGISGEKPSQDNGGLRPRR